ncbi:PEP/pyruvate-binding domain-containing protein [Nocardia sp. CA-119907]|uniref:PEP/pyruvate-binding domain-containing protein n=1 Tax=Nocardia sp. CA-119907 TaxID=3239973 RepID=UPI003D980DEE
MIVDLANAPLPPDLWGNKAARLSKLATEGLPIPPALCLQPGAVTGLWRGSILGHWLAALTSDRVVLRSSTQADDRRDDAGAGKTVSLTDLPPSTEHLIRVIEQEIEPDLSRYEGGRCCILQEQIPCVLGGVAFKTPESLVVEGCYDTPLATTGGEVPQLRLVCRDGVREWEFIDHDSVQYQRLAAQIEDLATRVHTVMRTPVDMEWMFDGRSVFVVQARPVTAPLTSEAQA